MNINSLKNSKFSQNLKNKVISLGIATSLLTGLNACSSNKQQENNINKTETTVSYKQKQNAKIKNEAEMPQSIENTYQNLLNHRGKTCYVVNWVGENMGGDNPAETIFLSKEDIHTFYFKEKGNWEISKTKLTDEMILKELEEYAMIDGELSLFWYKKIEEFQKQITE